MPKLFVDLDPALPDAPAFAGDTSDLVFFLSWAYSARFGASHELALAAQVLRNDLGIDLRPLLNYADRDVEEDLDREALDRAWQDAAPVAAAAQAVADALDDRDDRLAAVRRDFPALRDRLADLARIATVAAEQGARIRLSYRLEDAP